MQNLLNKNGEGWRFPASPFNAYYLLLDFSLGASFDQFLQCCISVSLGYAFLDSLRCAINQVLGFLQAESGQFTNCLDHVDLVVASGGQDYVELGLFFGSGSWSCCTACCWSCCDCS